MAEVERRTIRARSYSPLLKSTARRFQPYVTAAGQASLQWNILYEEMGSVFLSLMFEGYSVQKATVWSSVASDRGKRDMLLAAADSRKPLPSDAPIHEIERRAVICKRVHELCGMANELEIKRNNIIHAPLYIGRNAFLPDTFEKVIPDTSLGNIRAKPLVGKDLLREFRYCRDYAAILGDFAMAIDRAICSPSSTLPRKPSPPNRGDVKQVRHRKK